MPWHASNLNALWQNPSSFDKPSTNGDSKALPKKSTTVKVGLSADGKASVYVVAAGDSDFSSGAS